MTPPILAAFYTALAALLYLWQITMVVRGRRAGGVSLGDGGDPSLTRAIRGQGNSAEQMPLMLLMLALVEMIGAPGIAVHVVAIMFLVGRVLHALHFTDILPSMKARMYGMMLTLLSVSLTALGLLAHAAVQLV